MNEIVISVPTAMAKDAIDFDGFWKAASAIYKVVGCPIGSKALARKRWEQKKPDFLTALKWLEAMAKQATAKIELKRAGEFTAPFQHLERWIKNERYEDEPEAKPIKTVGNILDQAEAAAQRIGA